MARKPGNTARRTLKQMDAASDRMQRRMVVEVQRYGLREHKVLADFFAREKYYPPGSNRLARLGGIGAAWRRRKRVLRLKGKRGQAGGAMLKAARSPSSFIRNKFGFSISWPRANFTTRGGPGPRGGMYGPQKLNTYFGFYNEQKARSSLGVLAPKQRQRIIKQARQETLRRFAKTIKGAKFVKGAGVIIETKLDPVRFRVG